MDSYRFTAYCSPWELYGHIWGGLGWSPHENISNSLQAIILFTAKAIHVEDSYDKIMIIDPSRWLVCQCRRVAVLVTLWLSLCKTVNGALLWTSVVTGKGDGGFEEETP
jgi:hypothetical protein